MATEENSGSSLLQLATLQVVRPTGHLAAKPVSGADLSSPKLSDRLIAVRGEVQQTKAQRLNQVDLELAVDGTRIPVRISDWTGLNPTHLVGATIRLEGILDQTGQSCLTKSCGSLIRTDRQRLTILSHVKEVNVPTVATPSLTTVQKIHQLSADQADRQLPVRLSGVVTAVDPTFFFLQDSSGGIFVDTEDGKPVAVKVGQRITMTGKTGPGQFAPIVVYPHVEASRPGNLPIAGPLDLTRVLSGTEDSNWIQLEAIVRSAEWEFGSAYLRAETNGVPFRIAVLGAHELPIQLIDRKVRVQGVCATEFNLLRQLTGFYVESPSLDFIHPEEPTRSVNDVPLRAIAEFGSFRSQKAAGHRERVQGIVTFHSSLYLYIQNNSGALKVELPTPVSDIQVSDSVAAVGFSKPKAFGPVMTDSSVQKIGIPRRIPPQAITAEDLLDQGLEGESVTVEASLSDRSTLASGEVLSMHAGRLAFPARLEGLHAPPAALGSTLRLTGIRFSRRDPDIHTLPTHLHC